MDYLIMLVQVTLEIYRQYHRVTSPISHILNFHNEEFYLEHSTNLLI